MVWQIQGPLWANLGICRTFVLFDSPRWVIQWPLKNPVLPLHQLLSLHWCAPWHRYTPKVPGLGSDWQVLGLKSDIPKRNTWKKGVDGVNFWELNFVIQSLTYPNVPTLDDIRSELDPSHSQEPQAPPRSLSTAESSSPWTLLSGMCTGWMVVGIVWFFKKNCPSAIEWKVLSCQLE